MCMTPHRILAELEHRLSAGCAGWQELEGRLAAELEVGVEDLAAFRRVSRALSQQRSGGTTREGPRAADRLQRPGPTSDRRVQLDGLVERLVNEAARLHRDTESPDMPSDNSAAARRVLAVALAIEAQLRGLGPGALVLGSQLAEPAEEVVGVDR